MDYLSRTLPLPLPGTSVLITTDLQDRNAIILDNEGEEATEEEEDEEQEESEAINFETLIDLWNTATSQAPERTKQWQRWMIGILLDVAAGKFELEFPVGSLRELFELDSFLATNDD